MRAHLRGRRRSGEPIEAEVDFPDELELGDSFLFGAEGDRERVQITAMRTAVTPAGVEHLRVTLTPLDE